MISRDRTIVIPDSDELATGESVVNDSSDLKAFKDKVAYSRDTGARQVFARALDVISCFFYQGSVLYA